MDGTIFISSRHIYRCALCSMFYPSLLLSHTVLGCVQQFVMNFFSHSFGGYRHRTNAVLMRLFFRVKEFRRNNIVSSSFFSSWIGMFAWLCVRWRWCIVVSPYSVSSYLLFASKCHYRMLIKLHCTFKYIWIKKKMCRVRVVLGLSDCRSSFQVNKAWRWLASQSTKC